MAEDQTVHIVEWPPTPARLEHSFAAGTPAPVAIRFEPAPVHVAVGTAAGQALDVHMAMQVSAAKPVPLCLSLCEPICARSDYRIDITLFDRPVVSITVRGMTRLYNCNQER